ncbi:MAG: aminoacyl-tRNA hydrolase [Christensenellaceae bacterium]|jgi:PTH1 family peptidyl-tRNA hydrolase|nr:aminoacyl-tRNA hydrolase [Christensenellaceae bacterium]
MVIVGLGNPSIEYSNTFHNLGFMAIDALALSLAKKITRSECSSLTSSFFVRDEQIVLVKPMTYMNLSGGAIKNILSKYKEKTDNLLVIYDDFDIDRFSLRARLSGGPGTHNGMKNIVNELATTEFKRIRIGIGYSEADKKNYVLSHLSTLDFQIFKERLDFLGVTLKAYIFDHDFNKLMKTLNTPKNDKEKESV